MINPKLNLHHVRTAFIAWQLANAADFTPAQCRKTLLAGLLHDTGGLNEEARLQPLAFDDTEHNDHAAIGGELLASVPLLSPLSDIVRYHHTRWDHGRGAWINGKKVPEESHIIYLADRIDVLIAGDNKQQLLQAKEKISATILNGGNSLFKPEYISAFHKFFHVDGSWQRLQSTDFNDYIKEIPRIHNDYISLHNFRDIAAMLAFHIDGFSQHGVQYSLATGRISGYLARALGIAPTQCLKIETGGFLHNLSQLSRAIPGDGEEGLSPAWATLSPITEIQDIASWCQALDKKDTHSISRLEVRILRAGVFITSLLQDITTQTEFFARMAQTGEIAPELAYIVQNHHRAIMQIYQDSVRERRRLVERINRLAPR
nr:HD domain-containing protein [Intestinirhabdus alba]